MAGIRAPALDDDAAQDAPRPRTIEGLPALDAVAGEAAGKGRASDKPPTEVRLEATDMASRAIFEEATESGPAHTCRADSGEP
mmetsp:Transcript_134012/g.428213  ORF Transcript_134012/g.428213 Transcript_134012/m.428213 type:complete len:83 (-) Transcript_134012:4582-4830(-)